MRDVIGPCLCGDPECGRCFPRRPPRRALIAVLAKAIAEGKVAVAPVIKIEAPDFPEAVKHETFANEPTWIAPTVREKRRRRKGGQ